MKSSNIKEKVKEKSKGFLKSKVFSIIIISISVFLLMLIFNDLTLTIDRHAIFDWFLNIRNPGHPSEDIVEKAIVEKPIPKAKRDIVLVGIDKNALSPGKLGEFPWPRKVYINIFDYFLKDDGNSSYPKGILLDIAFLSKRKGEEETDKIVAEKIKKNGNVFLEYYLDYKRPTQSKSKIEKEAIEYIEKKFTLPIDVAKYKGKKLSPALKKKYNNIWKDIIPTTYPYYLAGKYLGTPALREDTDKKYRKIPLVYVYQNRIHFNVVFEMIMDYYGVNKNDIDIDFGRYITINNIRKNSKVKTLKIPVDIFGQMTIDFVGNAGHIWPVRSIYDVYANRIPKKFFQNKYVFIGVYASGAAKDVFFSPVGLMFGMEYLAVAFNQLRNQLFYKPLSTFASMLLLFIIILILTFIISYRPIFQAYILTGLLFILYTIIAYLAFKQYILLPYVSVVAGSLISLLTVVVYRVFTEEKEKKFIRATFSNFVSKVVVDELLKHPEMIKLGGEKKIITVLFSDIRSFTSISERLKPEEIVNILNNYLSRMTDVIFKYHGTLDKYVGDEIMAFWGAPIEQEDHATLACLAALEMIEELHKFNETLPEEKRLKIGIGINSGEVIVGNMGSASRMDYTIIGDNVNLGARLEGTNKIYKAQIIISEYTYELIKDYFIVRLLDKIRVKGKSIPVKIYELIDVKEDFDVNSLLKKYAKKR